MSRDQFRAQVTAVTEKIANMPLDATLERFLNTHFGADSEAFQQLKQGCQEGISEGWMCQHEAGGIKYGRVFQSSPELQEFSVDVVDMKDIVGPHHTHPQGEIDLMIPMDAHARFDDHGAGWVVYEPGSAHRPTVQGGRALVLYLLPHGAIEFSKT